MPSDGLSTNASGALKELEQFLDQLQIKDVAKFHEVAQNARHLTRGMAWIPNVGPQTDAYFCTADILLYGGQGGGGKTDLGLGLAFTAHQRSLIMRRQYADLAGLTDRAIEINGGTSGFNGSPPPKLRTRDRRLIRFGANQSAGDEAQWQGQPFDLKYFDEAVQFLEQQIRFHLGWVRSAVKGQRSRSILGSNPPIDAEGQWIIPMFGPWLDLTHPKPAKPGELRWYVTDPDGKDFEVPGPEPHQFAGVGQTPRFPQSRTFIPAELRDNPYLVQTNYQSALDSLPEPYRSAIRDGNFMAAKVDAEDQVIPTAWVLAAQKRWNEMDGKPAEGVPMCAIGVDCSGGGRDPMIIAPRYDGFFPHVIEVPGKDIPVERIGTYCAGQVVSYRKDEAIVVVDMGGGYGGPIFEVLKSIPINVVPYKGAAGGGTRTQDGQRVFYNKRSEIIWRFREALDPDQREGSPIMLPPDPMLTADLTAPTFQNVRVKQSLGIKVESKEDVCARLGRSTDKGDAVQMAWSSGLKMSNVKGGFTNRSKNRPQGVMGHTAARGTQYGVRHDQGGNRGGGEHG